MLHVSCHTYIYIYIHVRRCKTDIIGDELDIITGEGRKDVLEGNLCSMLVSRS